MVTFSDVVMMSRRRKRRRRGGVEMRSLGASHPEKETGRKRVRRWAGA